MRKSRKSVLLWCGGMMLLCGSAKAPEYGHFTKTTMPPAPTPVVVKWHKARVSYYGPGFDGRKMANGEKFPAYQPYHRDQAAVAHKSLPFGTVLAFRNPKNDKRIEAVVTDRGPYVGGREFDLSQWGAKQLGIIAEGVPTLEYTVIGRIEPARGKAQRTSRSG